MSHLMRVAIIGAGYTAKEHAKAFAALPNVTLAGIYSLRHDQAQAVADTYGIAAVYDSVEALYQGTQAHLVIVTVYETSMQAVCLACMPYPWTLFVEKPPGMNVAEAEAIHAAAQQHQRAVYVALNRRFYSSTVAALQDLNAIDAPRYIVVQDQEDRTAALAAGQPPIVVQHWMYANSIHMVDYLRIFGRGEITNVNIIQAWAADQPSPIVRAALTFSSGDRAHYEAIWEAPAPWAVSVTTPQRRWEMRPVEDATYQNGGERQRHPVERDEWDKSYKPGFYRQAEAVLAAINGQPSESVTLADALETMRLIQRIYGV